MAVEQLHLRETMKYAQPLSVSTRAKETIDEADYMGSGYRGIRRLRSLVASFPGTGRDRGEDAFLRVVRSLLGLTSRLAGVKKGGGSRLSRQPPYRPTVTA